MTFFKTIIALLVAFLILNSVVSGSWRRVFLVLFLLLIFLFFSLIIRFDGLIGTGWSGDFAVGLLCFLGFGLLDVG